MAIIATLLWTTHTVHIAPDKILDLETSGDILYPDPRYGSSNTSTEGKMTRWFYLECKSVSPFRMWDSRYLHNVGLFTLFGVLIS